MPIDKSLKTEPSEFRLFRCDHGCFHLEWKYFAIVHILPNIFCGSTNNLWAFVNEALRLRKPARRDARVWNVKTTYRLN